MRRLLRRKDNSKVIGTLILLVVFVVLFTTLLHARKSVCLIINGKQQNLITYQSTVKQVLASEGIKVSSHDKLTPPLESRLSNNSTITLKHAVSVELTDNGKDLTEYSAEDNVKSLLVAEGIKLGSEDRVTPEINTKLAEGMHINIVRVEHKTVTTTDSIPFGTIRRPDNSLPNTYMKTVQNGKPGEKETVFDVIYENGKEIARNVMSQKIITNTTDQIVVMGTFPLMPISRGGEQLDYKKVLRVKATAYYAVNGIGNTYTSTGVKATRNPDGYSTIAVDPNVIPYGSKLFIEGYGLATAADTGTAIKGNWIDVFFDTYREACNWSVKYVNVYILS